MRKLFESFEVELNVDPRDLEIEIIETPAENWGFRGFHGDEVQLDYRVDI